MTWNEHVPADLADLYEIHDYRHAAAILACEFPTIFAELCAALREFRFAQNDIVVGGGNESRIPKRLSSILRPLGWVESKLRARILVDETEVRADTHKVDYLKGRVAFDLEWNSKGQAFDRSVDALRVFFEMNQISVAVLLEVGNSHFGTAKRDRAILHHENIHDQLSISRTGGCPILVFGFAQEFLV